MATTPTVITRNSRWFLRPMQFLIHRQKWSNRNTGRSQCQVLWARLGSGSAPSSHSWNDSSSSWPGSTNAANTMVQKVVTYSTQYTATKASWAPSPATSATSPRCTSSRQAPPRSRPETSTAGSRGLLSIPQMTSSSCGSRLLTRSLASGPQADASGLLCPMAAAAACVAASAESPPCASASLLPRLSGRAGREVWLWLCSGSLSGEVALGGYRCS
mmetsp:Transcript_9210/g.25895  ORF Transcript_9210/g.25895 Transcript_9210/m.25895 type:complete len:216 (-) Transcript_9210:479-1126(-)